jgi:replicative DNA helicase
MAESIDSLPPAEPHAPEAEDAVLGAILLDNKNYDRVVGTLKAEDFYSEVNAEIFAAAESFIRESRLADINTLSPLFRDKKIGEASVLSKLHKLPNQAPRSPERFWAYVTEIVHFSAQRRVLKAGRTLVATVANYKADLPGACDATMRELDQALSQTRARVETCFAIEESAQRALDAYSKNEKGLPTGLGDLDKLTGGLFPGEITFLGGRPGSGKTSLASVIGLNLAKAGHPVLMFSLEMPDIPVAQRVLSSLCYFTPTDKIPYFRFRNGLLSESDLERLRNAKQRLDQVPFYIESRPALTLAEINARTRKLQATLEAESKGRIALIIIDYLTLIRFSDRWKGQRVYEVAEASAGLKELGRSMDCHMLVLAQLNRAVESRDDKRPQLADFRESGSLEQDADNAWFAYREEYYVEREPDYSDPEKAADKEKRLEACKNKMEVILAKQRMGAAGTASLFCDIGSNYIRNYSPETKPF